MKDLIKWGLIGVGGYLLYERFVAPAGAAPTSPTGSAGGTTGNPSPAGSFSISDLITALKGPLAPVSPIVSRLRPETCPTGYSGSYPDCVAPPPPPPPPPATPTVKLDSIDYGSQEWQTRVADALGAAAGGNGRTFDDWSFYYQNQIGGSPLSVALFGGMLDAAGVSRAADGSTPLVTAEQFATYLVDAKSMGLSGIRTPLRIPVPAMSRRVKALPVPPVAVIHLGNGRTALLKMGGN